MTLFNPGFYPTPGWLVEKMIAPLDLGDAHVLDPQAGKGDILDGVAQRYRDHHTQLYAIEIEPELRSILEGKGYPLLFDDFLSYVPTRHFTHILMNPPFARAEDHLLKAWEVLYEGEIACLFPATHLEGKTAKEKTIRRLIEDHGSSDNLGPVFAHAEQPTQADIALVRLSKKANGPTLEWEVTNDREDPEFDEGKGQELALTGFIADLLSNFNAALAHYAAYNQARQQILRYVHPFGNVWTADHRSVKIMETADDRLDPRDRYNTFVDLLQQAAWLKILDHPRFQSILTDRARKMMADFRARQRRVDFNERNIEAMFAELVGKQGEILMGAILDAFDTMTAYHKENRVYFEGWNSNQCWRVSRKVVLPHFVKRCWSGRRVEIDYSDVESLNDIDRAMCVVTGQSYDTITRVESVVKQTPPGELLDSTFFKVRAYLKGTLHLTFKDKEVWKRFNRMAAAGRNWLPPGDPEEAGTDTHANHSARALTPA